MDNRPQIVYRKTVDLERLRNNPRYWTEEDKNSLMASMRGNPEHFYGRPLILSDRTGIEVVIAGNLRLECAVDLGIKEVPTVLLSGLTLEKEQEIAVRDNVNNGRWEYDILANEWPDKDLLKEWGVPPVWEYDIEEDEEKPERIKDLNAKITIEFESAAQMESARVEIVELLRSYEGAAIK